MKNYLFFCGCLLLPFLIEASSSSSSRVPWQNLEKFLKPNYRMSPEDWKCLQGEALVNDKIDKRMK